MDMTTLTVITSLCTVLLIYLMVRRLFHPFHCKCGYVTWSASNFIFHVEVKHAREV